MLHILDELLKGQIKSFEGFFQDLFRSLKGILIFILSEITKNWKLDGIINIKLVEIKDEFNETLGSCQKFNHLVEEFFKND